MELLRGRDGIDGRDGEKGDIGPPGAQGERGVTGPLGPVGEKGEQSDPGMRGSLGEPGLQGPPGGGAIYTRWGWTTCLTDQGTQLLYAGRAGGTHRGQQTFCVCLIILTISSTRVEYKELLILGQQHSLLLLSHCAMVSPVLHMMMRKN